MVSRITMFWWKRLCDDIGRPRALIYAVGISIWLLIAIRFFVAFFAHSLTIMGQSVDALLLITCFISGVIGARWPTSHELIAWITRALLFVAIIVGAYLTIANILSGTPKLPFVVSMVCTLLALYSLVQQRFLTLRRGADARYTGIKSSADEKAPPFRAE